jgi:hypothetical protein
MAAQVLGVLLVYFCEFEFVSLIKGIRLNEIRRFYV